MIGLLQGVIRSKNQNPILLMVGGVGYSVFVAERLLGRLSVGEPYTLYIYTHVTDSSLDLFGFQTQEELALFKLLLTVSGIGPRTALPIIDRGVSEIRRAVATSDVEFFTTIPRLGKKNAQKIIIELKSKLGSIEELDLTGDSMGETREVLDVLVSMGFARQEAVTALRKLSPEDVTIEQKIRRALKLLGPPNTNV